MRNAYEEEGEKNQGIITPPPITGQYSHYCAIWFLYINSYFSLGSDQVVLFTCPPIGIGTQSGSRSLSRQLPVRRGHTPSDFMTIAIRNQFLVIVSTGALPLRGALSFQCLLFRATVSPICHRTPYACLEVEHLHPQAGRCGPDYHNFSSAYPPLLSMK